MTTAFLSSWLVVSALMSALVAGAALLAQQLVGRAVPARIVWAIALIAAAGITATQPLRRASTRPTLVLAGLPLKTDGTLAVEPSLWTRISNRVTALRAAPEAAMTAIASTALDFGTRIPAPMSRLLLIAWPVASGGIALVLLLSYRRQRALLDRADRLEMAGTPVHVSASTGPVVIGAATPAIVVPAWLLERSEEEQRLVVAHEAAHIAAGDPQLLLAGCALVALMPWNVAAWFMLARLRLAIELDCDARVLARGTNTRRYGQLLIELSAAMPRPRIPLGAPAFSYRPSHLERRLRTMTARPTRFLAARRVSALVVGSAALLAACGAELPTATELQGMDVAKAETKIGKAVRLDSVNTVYIVDGKRVAAGDAKRIVADSIITINVRKGSAKDNEISIVTKNGNAKVVQGHLIASNTKSDAVMVSDSGKIVNGILYKKVEGARAEPMIFIDGKKSTKADLDKLSPNAIESVEVVKGVAAATAYGPEAAGGAIRITLKK